MSLCRIAVGSLVMLSLVAMTARADPAGGQGEAKKLFFQGKQHYDDRHYAEALAIFQQALRLTRRSSIILMVARCYRRLQRVDRALAYFEQYLQAWSREGHEGKSRHRAEVKHQIDNLRTIVDLVQRARALGKKGQHRAALSLLEAALRLSPWAQIHGEMARCHQHLGSSHRALSSLKVAMGYWEGYQINWTSRHPHTQPPDHQHARRQIARLRDLERAIRGKAVAAGSPPGHVKQDEREASRTSPSMLWLSLGITSAVLVVGAEVMAWVAYSEATDYYEWDPEYSRYRSLTVAGHVTAGAMAVASGLCFYLYHRSGRKTTAPRASVLLLVPAPGGLLATGRFTF